MSELFETQFAYSPENQQLIKGATFTAHDVTTGDALATTDALGSALTLMSDSNGALPPFKVAGDRVQVEIRNGAFKTVLTTTAGVAARESARAITEQIDDPESDLNVGLTAKTVRTAGAVVSAGPSVMQAPEFTVVGNVLTHSASGAPSIYFPAPVYLGDLAPSAPGRFVLAYSTDHDSGAGGLAFAFANSPEGPFTTWANGGNWWRYRDSTVGTQTETPSIVIVPDDPDGKPIYIYYSQSETPFNQSTFLAKTADFATFTRVGMVIEGRSLLPGDGQTTYALVSRVDGMFIAVHMLGGGDFGRRAISYSRDGVNWVMDPRRFQNYVDRVGFTNGRRFQLGQLFKWRGEMWAACSALPHASGFWTGASEAFIVRVTPDLRMPAGQPIKLPGKNGGVLVHDGVMYIYYRTGDAFSAFAVQKAVA